MAAVLDQMTEFYVDSKTTTPVILSGVAGKDYVLLRRKTSSTNVKLRTLCVLTGGAAGTVDVGGSDVGVNCIIPDTPFNRRQLEKDNNADWSYALTFANGTEIEVAVPINNIIVSVIWTASSGNIDLNSGLEMSGSGKVKVQAQNGRCVGKSLTKVTDGTGDQVIAMVLYASAITGTVMA